MPYSCTLNVATLPLSVTGELTTHGDFGNVCPLCLYFLGERDFANLYNMFGFRIWFLVLYASTVYTEVTIYDTFDPEIGETSTILLRENSVLIFFGFYL